MFYITGYFNTGFDIINVPDSPALLRQSASRVFPALDILNKRFLGTIRIKIDPTAGENALAGLEYLELYEEGRQAESVFYYVSSYQLTSRDVAILSVVQDSFLTIGGISAFSDASLFAKRAHIKKSDDTFAKWTEDDELLCPNEPLQLAHSGTAQAYDRATPVDGAHNGVWCDANTGQFFKFGKIDHPGAGIAYGIEQMIVTSVGITDDHGEYLDPSYIDTDLQFAGQNYIANPATSSLENTNDRYPLIPEARGILFHTSPVNYRYNSMTGAPSEASFRMPVDFNPNFNFSSTYDKGFLGSLALLRDLGMEDAVLFSYRLRESEASFIWRNDGTLQEIYGKTYFAQAKGNTSAYRFDAGKSAANVHNNRVLYGKFRSYVLSSPATGSTITAKPEELYPSISGNLIDSDVAPYIVCFTDPRPTGRPYYNFFKLGQVPENAYEGNRYINISLGAIAGGQWPEVPVKFTGFSGVFQAKVGYALNASYNDWIASTDNSYLSMMSGQSYNTDYAFDKAGRMRQSGQAYTWLAAVPFVGKGVKQGQSLASQYGTPYMIDEGVGESPSSYDANAGFNMTTGGIAGGLINAVASWGTAMVANDVAKMTAEDSAENSYYAAKSAAEHDAYGHLENNYEDTLRRAQEGSASANTSLQRMISRFYEYEKFSIGTSYAVPTINFMSSDTMRDVNDNSVFYARYTPSTRDLKRMDEILDAFGYKVNMKVDWEYMKNRRNFNYFQGSVDMFNWKNSKVIQAKPGARDIMLDVNNQLANGIRIWHVTPSGSELDPGN